MGRILAILIGSFLLGNQAVMAQSNIAWMNWNAAIDAQKKEPKKIFVFVYRKDCPHSAKMDSISFKDTAVVYMLNFEFFPVRLNAESTDTVLYQCLTLINEKSGDFNFHQLAVSLLNGDMSFPSIVILDEDEKRINLSKGYKNATVMQNTLVFFADDGHKANQAQQFGAAYKCVNPNHRHGQTSFGPTIPQR
jgi:thioredoxin-related protein